MVYSMFVLLLIVFIFYLYGMVQTERRKLHAKIIEYDELAVDMINIENVLAKIDLENDQLKSAIKDETKKLYSKIVEYDDLILNRNVWIQKYLDLKNSTNSASGIFSLDELKRIGFCIHPDKTGNKTTDLWMKVNNLIEMKK